MCMAFPLFLLTHRTQFSTGTDGGTCPTGGACPDGTFEAVIGTGLVTLTPSNPPKFTSVSTLSSAAAGSSPLPAYNPAGGPAGGGHSEFRSTSSQFLNAGPRTLKVGTHKGMTLVAVVKFTGSAGSFERILEGGNGSVVTEGGFLLGREGTSTDLAFKAFDASGGALCVIMCAGFIVQDEWMAVVVRYDGRSGFVEVCTESQSNLIYKVLIYDKHARARAHTHTHTHIDFYSSNCKTGI